MALSKTFTEQQAAFVRHAADGVDLEQAARLAGYADSFANDAAGRLRREPAIIAAVQIEVARRLAMGSAVATRVLLEFIADESLDKRLRVACIKTVLDRAGHIAPKAVERTGEGRKGLNEMNMDELRAERDKLEGEIAGRAKEVSSASKAPNDTQALDDII